MSRVSSMRAIWKAPVRQLWDECCAWGKAVNVQWYVKRYTETYRQLRIELTHAKPTNMLRVEFRLKEQCVEVEQGALLTKFDLTPDVMQKVTNVLTNAGINIVTNRIAAPAFNQLYARTIWDRVWCIFSSQQWNRYLYREDVNSTAEVWWSNGGPSKVVLGFARSGQIMLTYRENKHQFHPNDFTETWRRTWTTAPDIPTRMAIDRKLHKLGITTPLLYRPSRQK